MTVPIMLIKTICPVSTRGWFLPIILLTGTLAECLDEEEGEERSEAELIAAEDCEAE